MRSAIRCISSASSTVMLIAGILVTFWSYTKFVAQWRGGEMKNKQIEKNKQIDKNKHTKLASLLCPPVCGELMLSGVSERMKAARAPCFAARDAPLPRYTACCPYDSNLKLYTTILPFTSAERRSSSAKSRTTMTGAWRVRFPVPTL